MVKNVWKVEWDLPKKRAMKNIFEEMSLTEKGRMGRRGCDAMQDKEHKP